MYFVCLKLKSHQIFAQGTFHLINYQALFKNTKLISKKTSVLPMCVQNQMDFKVHLPQ